MGKRSRHVLASIENGQRNGKKSSKDDLRSQAEVAAGRRSILEVSDTSCEFEFDILSFIPLISPGVHVPRPREPPRRLSTDYLFYCPPAASSTHSAFPSERSPSSLDLRYHVAKLGDRARRARVAADVESLHEVLQRHLAHLPTVESITIQFITGFLRLIERDPLDEVTLLPAVPAAGRALALRNEAARTEVAEALLEWSDRRCISERAILELLSLLDCAISGNCFSEARARVDSVLSDIEYVTIPNCDGTTVKLRSLLSTLLHLGIPIADQNSKIVVLLSGDGSSYGRDNHLLSHVRFPQILPYLRAYNLPIRYSSFAISYVRGDECHEVIALQHAEIAKEMKALLNDGLTFCGKIYTISPIFTSDLKFSGYIYGVNPSSMCGCPKCSVRTRGDTQADPRLSTCHCACPTNDCDFSQLGCVSECDDNCDGNHARIDLEDPLNGVSGDFFVLDALHLSMRGIEGLFRHALLLLTALCNPAPRGRGRPPRNSPVPILREMMNSRIKIWGKNAGLGEDKVKLPIGENRKKRTKLRGHESKSFIACVDGLVEIGADLVRKWNELQAGQGEDVQDDDVRVDSVAIPITKCMELVAKNSQAGEDDDADVNVVFQGLCHLVSHIKKFKEVLELVRYGPSCDRIFTSMGKDEFLDYVASKIKIFIADHRDSFAYMGFPVYYHLLEFHAVEMMRLVDAAGLGLGLGVVDCEIVESENLDLRNAIRAGPMADRTLFALRRTWRRAYWLATGRGDSKGSNKRTTGGAGSIAHAKLTKEKAISNKENV